MLNAGNQRRPRHGWAGEPPVATAPGKCPFGQNLDRGPRIDARAPRSLALTVAPTGDHEARGGDALEILRKQPSTKGEPEIILGDAWIDVIVSGEGPARVWVTVVRFVPGARMAWHAHALGQTVHVTEGLGLIQSRGGAVLEIRAGDTVRTPPGEWHWHGAAPDHFLSHLAIW